MENYYIALKIHIIKTDQKSYFEEEESLPELGFLGKKVTDDATNYQILSLLEGVVTTWFCKKG